MRESLYSFFCGIRSRVVLPFAFSYSVQVCNSYSDECYFSRFDNIFYSVSVRNGKKSEAFYFNSVKLDLKFPFTLSLANPSCHCHLCPGYFVDTWWSFKGCWGKLASKPPSTLTIPLSSFPTFTFKFGREECVNYPKNCCSDAKKLFPFDGKVDSVIMNLSLSGVSIIFNGTANLKNSHLSKSEAFRVDCSLSPQNVFIEYGEDFAEFLLKNYRTVLWDHFPHILTFSQERKVKNLLLKIKSLLGG